MRLPSRSPMNPLIKLSFKIFAHRMAPLLYSPNTYSPKSRKRKINKMPLLFEDRSLACSFVSYQSLSFHSHSSAIIFKINSNKLNQHRSHIVAPSLISGITGQQKVQQVLQNIHSIRIRLLLIPNPCYQRLRVLHVPLPNPITSHYDKLIILVSVELSHIRPPTYQLLVPFQVPVLLVVEVPQTPRKVQTPIYTAVNDVSTCFVDAL